MSEPTSGAEKKGLVEEIKTVGRKQVATSVVAAAAGLIGIVALALSVYIKQYLTTVVGGVPPGAVMAFDLKQCPRDFGWEPFEDARGRVVVGAGKGDGLTPRAVGFSGGQESYLLSEKNIPKHQHDTFLGDGGRHSFWGQTLLAATIPGNGNIDPNMPAAKTGFYGAGPQEQEGVPTMPPFISLVYCKKT